MVQKKHCVQRSNTETLKHKTIDGLVESCHITATQDVAIESEERKVERWKVHEERLPNWSSAVKEVLLVQPSSATAERVLSPLSASFHEAARECTF